MDAGATARILHHVHMLEATCEQLHICRLYILKSVQMRQEAF